MALRRCPSWKRGESAASAVRHSSPASPPARARGDRSIDRLRPVGLTGEAGCLPDQRRQRRHVGVVARLAGQAACRVEHLDRGCLVEVELEAFDAQLEPAVPGVPSEGDALVEQCPCPIEIVVLSGTPGAEPEGVRGDRAVARRQLVQQPVGGGEPTCFDEGVGGGEPEVVRLGTDRHRRGDLEVRGALAGKLGRVGGCQGQLERPVVLACGRVVPGCFARVAEDPGELRVEIAAPLRLETSGDDLTQQRMPESRGVIRPGDEAGCDELVARRELRTRQRSTGDSQELERVVHLLIDVVQPCPEHPLEALVDGSCPGQLLEQERVAGRPSDEGVDDAGRESPVQTPHEQGGVRVIERLESKHREVETHRDRHELVRARMVRADRDRDPDTLGEKRHDLAGLLVSPLQVVEQEHAIAYVLLELAGDIGRIRARGVVTKRTAYGQKRQPAERRERACLDEALPGGVGSGPDERSLADPRVPDDGDRSFVPQRIDALVELPRPPRGASPGDCRWPGGVAQVNDVRGAPGPSMEPSKPPLTLVFRRQPCSPPIRSHEPEESPQS